jgi:hypothetical protein
MQKGKAKDVSSSSTRENLQMKQTKGKAFHSDYDMS